MCLEDGSAIRSTVNLRLPVAYSRSPLSSSIRYNRSALRFANVDTLPDGQVILSSSAWSICPRPKVRVCSTEER